MPAPPFSPTALCTSDAWAAETLALVADHLSRRFHNGQLAAEAATDALSRLWEKAAVDPGFFRSPAHMRNWARRVARHQIVNHLRWQQRHHPLPPEDGAPQPPRVRRSGPGHRPLRQSELPGKFEVLARLDGCLRRLPARYRLALHGNYFEGLTDSELGPRLFKESLEPGARGQRARRVRLKAQRELGRVFCQGSEGVSFITRNC
jgi:RNA polymerase sigma factor (sigma-70 family)